jgi:secondary thiamine-phosphate synthase enzyme
LSQRPKLGHAPDETVMKIFSTSISVTTEQRTQLTDVTGLVTDAIRTFPVNSGMVLINTLHTTCALIVNEFQAAIMDDVWALLHALVPNERAYRHNDARYSDCERGNAQAHLRAILLGRSVALPIQDGELALGRFQSVILAEFDGPRRREMSVQVIGE